MSDDHHHDPEAHERAVRRARAYRRSFFPDATETLRANRRAFLTGAGAAVAGGMLSGTAAASDEAANATSSPEANDKSEGFSGEPRGIHASYTDDPSSSVTLTWFTDGLRDPGTIVEYGADPSLGEETTGTAGPVPDVDALVHRATITGLEPGQTVHYRVGGDSGFSDAHEVTVHDGDDEFSFTFLGDQGVSDDALANRDLVADLDPDLHFVIGDVSYADGDSPVWDLYFGQQESLMASVPTMNQVGNHEFKGGAGAPDYVARHSHPEDGQIEEPLCYSFRHGKVHFCGIDNSGSVLSEGRLVDVLTWVENDLARARQARVRGDVEYIVAFMHHPLYTNQGARATNPLYQILVEPALHRHDVDLVLTGHDHIYERSFPMVYGVPTTAVTSPYTPLRAGFVHVQNGLGGQSIRRVRPEHQRASWSAAAYDRGYCATRVDNEGKYGFYFRTVTVEDREVVDEFRMLPQVYEEPVGDALDEIQQEQEAATAAIERHGPRITEYAETEGLDAAYFEELDSAAIDSVPGATDLARRLMDIGSADPVALLEEADASLGGVEIPTRLDAVAGDRLDGRSR